ncbi:MAG: hypothetical protein SGI96_02800 [Bacteroidota bacterium]|nr:hypothetical protein [Bacteroidota bacterium]
MKQILSSALIVVLACFTACTSTNRLISVTTNEAKEIISGWPAKTQEVATTMMTKYGAPNEVTGTMLVWHNNGPWKKTIIHKEPVQHNFPMPHVDLLEQFVDYSVPADKYDQMALYDGSVVIARTAGEMSARCDKEEANFLALNLANDVATGKKTVEDARMYYARSMKEMMQGKMDPYLQKLHFNVGGDTKFADQKAPGM